MPEQGQFNSISRHIVLRKGINIYGRYLAVLEARINKSNIKTLAQDNYLGLMSVLSTKPMLSRYYLVYASVGKLDKVDHKYLDFLKVLSTYKWIYLVITTEIRETFDGLRFIKAFNSFTFLNCYGLSNDILHAYIRSELLANGASKNSVTEDVIKRIRTRIRYKEYTLDSVLPQLACTELKIADINRIISPYTGVTVSNFGRMLFEPKKKKPVADILCKYRKYPDTIFKNVQEYVNTWLKLYNDFHSGELCEDNAFQWLEEHGKQYNLLYEYQIRQWLESFSRYSYDFMILVLLQLESATNTVTKELALYKIYRMVNSNE